MSDTAIEPARECWCKNWRGPTPLLVSVNAPAYRGPDYENEFVLVSSPVYDAMLGALRERGLRLEACRKLEWHVVEDVR